MDWLRRDLRVGLRLLLRDKAFSLTAIATLAICIGTNTALFSVVRQVLLRPLPVPEPERLVLMSNAYPKAGAEDTSNSGVPDYYDRLQAVTALEDQALFRRSNVTLGQDSGPERIRVADVTPSFFAWVRVAPAHGRVFTADEGEEGHELKAILSDSLWRSRFGGDPNVVGRDVRLNGQPYTVVGILPASFEPFDPGVLLWRPLAFSAEDRSDDNRHSNSYFNVGRMKPGASLGQVQAQVDALNAANLERFPQYKELLVNAGFHTNVRGYADHLVRHVKPTLYLLWGGALFVLLIGGVNVANLTLVRARSRLKELATRMALGAGHAQVARQLVIESALLTLAAAGIGLLLGTAALRGLGFLDLSDLPYGSQVGLDGAVLAYALALSALAGLVIGLVPVLTVVPAQLGTVLREEGRASSGGRGARRLRRVLVAAQVAFTFVLLVGAGLLLASFRKVLEVDPGFVAEGVLTGSVVLPASRYPDDPARRAFTDEALRRVRALPGVVSAGATDTIPFGSQSSDSVILAEGYQMKPGESVISPASVDVTPGYFEAIGVRLASGRFVEDGDTADAPPVIVVDERLAQRFWPDQDPIGRRMYRPTDINDLLAVNEKTVFLTVVGVVRNVTLHDLTEGRGSVGAYYYPMAQDTSRLLTFAVKTTGPPQALTSGVRQAVAALDPELPLFDVQTLEQRAEGALVNRRSPAVLSLGFGLVALLLSAVGLYGVLAYLVEQRTKEIGIRLALGSSTCGIFDLVLREGVLLLSLGFVAGGAGAFLLRRSLQSQLFGVTATDPWVLVGATLLLAAVALGACALPARRASRIDPLVALSE